MIKMIFCDIDGCMGKFLKPEYPLKQSLDENISSLKSIKDKTDEFKGVLFGVATARSFYQADHIMKQANCQGPSIFEMGNVVFEPNIGTYNLFEKHKKFKENLEDIKFFIIWKREMAERESEIKNRFPFSGVRQMKDRQCMLTYEFNSDIGKELYNFIKTLMPQSIIQAIENKILRVSFSKNAIDILPNLNKGDAVVFLAEKYGVSKNEVLCIGDSSHSDLDLLNAAGIKACPDNADEALKEFVLSNNGFVAPNSYSQGLLNILEVAKRFIEFSNLKLEEDIFQNFNKKKILVIGDSCIDEFLEGDANSVSPEAPILRVLIDKIKINPGAAGNVALNVRALGAETYVAGIIGIDESSKQLIKLFQDKGINVEGMIVQENRVTSKFSRIVVGGKQYNKQSAIRFDIENKENVSGDSLKKIIDFINRKKNFLDAIIVADYDEVGSGLVKKELLNEIVQIATENNIPIIGDSRKNFHYFNNFTCITPNRFEAEALYGKKIESFNEMSNDIINRLKLDSILIKKDKDGMGIFSRDGKNSSIPAFAKEVIDVNGAGDSVISTFTLGLSCGLDYHEAAKLASYAAAIAVSKPGLSVVTIKELKEFIKENER